MTEMNKTRVLVIGAGRRIQNNFLPVLRCMDEFEIVGIHARRPGPLNELCARWSVDPIAKLDEVDFSNVDVVAISVPTAANADILSNLARVAPHVTVVVDTPIVWNLAELRDNYKNIDSFKKFYVTEDYMNFPTFDLMRSVVRDGLIGRIKTIELRNIGYLYHGLALIRSFMDFRRPVFAKATKSDEAVTVHYRYADGTTAFVEGPYRQMDGSITLRGSKAVISDSSAVDPVPPDYLLQLERDSSGLICGVAISQSSAPGKLVARREIPLIKAMASLDFPDKSDLNLLRGCGLHAIFASILRPDKLNDRYGPKNAFYDGFTSRLAERRIFRIDPFAALGLDIVRVFHAMSVLKSWVKGR